MSPCKDDFGSSFTPLSKTMMGLGESAQVKGEGTVDGTSKDDYGAN